MAPQPGAAVPAVDRSSATQTVFEIGATLREARVHKRLTLHQVEDDTKIRVKYLQAMENEEFASLPDPTYAQGFLRSYASYLGLDPQLFIDEYRSRVRPPADRDPFAGSSAIAPRSHPHHRRSGGLAFAALLAVLILVVIYVVGLWPNHGSSGPKTNPSVLRTQSSSPSPHTFSAGPGATTSPSSSGSPAAIQQSVVSLVASAPCYVDVREGSASGTPLFKGVLTPGTPKQFIASGALAIIVGGDPKNLSLTVNAHPVVTAGDKTGTVYLVNKGEVTKH